MNHLTHQLSSGEGTLLTSVDIKFPNITFPQNKTNISGFRLGIKGRFDDYRSAVITGKGIDVGITTDGFLYVGKQKSDEQISTDQLQKGIRLEFSFDKIENGYNSLFTAYNLSDNQILLTLKANIPAKEMAGNIALVCHFNTEKKQGEEPKEGILFSNWKISGTKVIANPKQVFGPIYFTQYTLNHNILKLSAQLAPLDSGSKEILIELKQNGQCDPDKNSWKEFKGIMPTLKKVGSLKVKLV